MTEQELQDAILRHALDLQRVAAADARKVDAVLTELADELRALLAAADLSEATKREIAALIKEAEEIIGASYESLGRITDTEKLARIVGEHTVEILGDIFPAVKSVPIERLASLTKDVLVDGSPASAWWKKQDDDTAFKFAAQVRQGVINGETQEQIVRRVVGGWRVEGGARMYDPGVLGRYEAKTGKVTEAPSRKMARSLVHSSVMTAANAARLETFRRNSDMFRGVRWLSTLDSHTCLRCAALDNAEWDLEGEPLNGSKFRFQAPPKHFSCRCVLTGLPKRSALEEAFPGISAEIDATAMRASSDGPVANQSFAEFLKRQKPEFIEGTLGKRRAEMFLAGDLTLTDLVSGTGRELALDELKVR